MLQGSDYSCFALPAFAGCSHVRSGCLVGILLALGRRNKTEQPEREVKHPTVPWEGWRDGGGVRIKTGFLNSTRCSNPIFCRSGPLTDLQLKSLENCHPARTAQTCSDAPQQGQ